MDINTSHATISFLHLDKVVPEWPNSKAERIEDTRRASETKIEKIKNELAYTYHPVNKPHQQGEIVDFVIA